MDRFKKFIIPFIIMLIFDLGFYYIGSTQNFGVGDFIRGYSYGIILTSATVTFGISYLSYKLWYSQFTKSTRINQFKLDTTYNLLKFLLLIFTTGIIFSVLISKTSMLTYTTSTDFFFFFYRYFLNYINFSFILGIIGLWISRKTKFIDIPKKSDKKINKNIYTAIFLLIIICTIIICIFSSTNNNFDVILQIGIVVFFIYLYNTRPITTKASISKYTSITEKVMDIFLTVTIITIIILTIYIYTHSTINAEIAFTQVDLLLLILFIPSLIVLIYIEKNVTKPIILFSKIKKFIKKGEKIESEKLLNVYSQYTDENNEIGMLSRSYTDLITNNNDYIENLHKIERERERIKAELDIAARIQQSNLPKKAIENEYFKVNGFSKPAREVGGDFFDYYELDDEHLVIVIGDGSGKGIPAALLSLITQIILRQTLKNETEPSKVLYDLNNMLCQNNPEAMFITLWVGLYNKKTKKLKFANGGHNPPLIKEKDKYEYLDIDNGIVLGILEDFEFKTEEITLESEIITYTDGITDASNNNNQMYGENNLAKFFNNFKSKEDPIEPLINDINSFTKDFEQYDDMTLVYLKINK